MVYIEIKDQAKLYTGTECDGTANKLIVLAVVLKWFDSCDIFLCITFIQYRLSIMFAALVMHSNDSEQ